MTDPGFGLRATDVYDYQDVAGDYLFTVVVERTDGEKRVKQGVRHDDGTYSWGLNGRPRVLYRLPALVQHLGAGRTDPVYVVEGEKDVETLRTRGLVATCNPMGAGKWTDDYTDVLAGARHVRVIADRDRPGHEHARTVADALRAVVEHVELLEPPEDLGEHADVTDLLDAGRTVADLVPLEPLEPTQEDAPLGPRFVSLDEFADTEEEGSEAVLGDVENAVIPEDGDVLLYGDGGVGKTTIANDVACHLAAGDPWLGIAVPRPLRVLIIENEGPRPRFRRKTRRKRDAWAGSPLGDRISVLEAPWGAFTFADERWREILADYVREHEIDVVICGPVTCAGMDAAGTLQEVRDFLALVADVRRRAGRRLVVVLVHHENKGGRVSGAWEGAGDTLLHVQGQGHGRLRLHFQKTRWASDYHGTTLQLLWAEGDSFQIEEKDELDDETLAEQIVAFIGENAGTGWTKVEEATPGVNRQRRRDVRDGLFAAQRIVNVVTEKSGTELALGHVPERRPSRLYLASDPAIHHLRPDPGADGAQTAPPGVEGATEHLRPAPRPNRGAEGAGAVRPPDVDLGTGSLHDLQEHLEERGS